ncbi:MAG: collagen binding domain-containing protein [Halanaerobiales bacterium]
MEWDSKDNIQTNFPERFWQYIEDTYSQFSQGDHSVTKAFDDVNDYISLTDDYDFCWGPDNEGDVLGENEYTQRLWGVYTKTAGEIYLLKSNTDINGWEFERRLVFAPSGSRRPNMIFDRNGHYRLVVEITPAGGQAEIWLLEYPYTNSNVRKLFDGSYPIIFRDFIGIVHIFYQSNNNSSQIHYRSSDDDFSTGKMVSEIESDSDVIPLAVFPITNENDTRQFILFYRVNNDIKYILSSPVALPTETMGTSLEINLAWEEYVFDVSFLIVDLLQNPIEGAEVTFADRTIISDVNGIASFSNVGGDYTLVEISHPDYDNTSFNVNITENDQITAELLGDIENIESMNTDIGINITWEDMRRDITFVVTDGQNPIENAIVIINEREKSTNSEGITLFEDIIAEEYNFTITAEGFNELNGSVNIEEDMTLEIELEPEQDTEFIEEVDININMNNEWEDMTYTVNFEIRDYETNVLVENVSVTLTEETKITDAQGKVTFINVIPYPTVEKYSVVLEHTDYETQVVDIVVQGNEETKEITVEIQLGIDTNFTVLEETSVDVGMSILWLEVEE